MLRSYATSNTAIFCGLNPGSPHHAGILASLASGVSRENLYLVHSVSECICTVVSQLHPSVPFLTSGLQRVYEFLCRWCCRPCSITPFFNLLLCQASTLISYPIYTWRSSSDVGQNYIRIPDTSHSFHIHMCCIQVNACGILCSCYEGKFALRFTNKTNDDLAGQPVLGQQGRDGMIMPRIYSHCLDSCAKFPYILNRDVYRNI